MDFKRFVEHWASIYKPMLHTPEAGGRNKRFFFCDGFAGMADWMRQQNWDRSPVVVMESGVDVSIRKDGWEYHDYVLYFCVRAATPSDGFDASASKDEAMSHARQFLLYVKTHERDFIADTKKPDLDQVNLTPIGPMWDAWNLVQMRITVAEAECKDIDKELLTEE